jgi:hypothetical protein
LEQKRRAKTVRGWLGVICFLALACFCISPGKAYAQTTAPSNTDSSKQTNGTKIANPAQHAKVAAAESSAGTASKAKAHTASHPPAGEHPKSNAAIAARNSKTKRASSRRKSNKTTARGQQKIDPERAQAIQEALIREHYLSGEAAGTWNQASEDAMRRYQADHGWQSKTVPDSRALISLGLGPSHDHLLNPESAMTTGPDASHTATASSAAQSPVSHSADPGTRMNTNTTSPADPAPTAASPDRDSPSPQ